MKVLLLWVVAQLVLRSRSQFTVLVLQNTVRVNNSDLLITEVGEGTAALSCRTSRSGCCKASPAGDWFYPNGQMVGLRSSGDNFYRNRDDSGNVFLHRRNNARIPRGIYYCIIPNDDGVMTKLQVGLYLPEDYPSVTRNPLSQSGILPGSNVSFSVEAVHATSYSWVFNNLPITDSSPRHIGVLTRTLTILNVSSEDVGSYLCVVRSSFLAEYSESADLTLTEPPALLIYAEDALNVLPGSTVSFIVFSFDLSADYLWIREDGRSINNTDRRFIGVTSRNLTITDIRLSDAGTYVCVVSNAGGSVRSKATLSLRVLPPVLVTSARDALNVELGSNVTFSVYVTGYNLMYLWELENGESLPTSDSRFIGVRSSEMTITDVRTSDADTYVCLVSNSGGSVRSTARLSIMLKAPVIEMEAQDSLNVEPGSNVSFSVTASGYSLEYNWKLGMELSTLPPSPRISGIRNYQLTISNVQHSDAGLYVCVVSNSGGSTRSNATLSIALDAPVIVKEAEDALNVPLGSNVTFAIEVTGHSLEYTWLGVGGTPLPTSPRFIGVRSHMLVIQDIRSSDAGVYSCVISNNAGTVMAHVTLSINPIPLSVESLTVRPSVTSAMISWTIYNASIDNILYEVEYHPTLFPAFVASRMTSLTSLTLDGLVPQLQYSIRVRVSNQSTWSSTELILNDRIPPVKDFAMESISGSTLSLSWKPVDIEGWNISYYYLTYHASPPTENARALSRRFIVDGRADSEAISSEVLVMKPGTVHVFELSAVLAVENLEGLGEVKGKVATFNTTFNYEKADRIRNSVRSSIAKAVSSRCNCSFTERNLGTDFFSCRLSKTIAIYRGSIVGYFSDIFLEHVKDWVHSNETILLDWFIVDVYPSCPVKLSSMHDMDCTVASDL